VHSGCDKYALDVIYNWFSSLAWYRSVSNDIVCVVLLEMLRVGHRVHRVHCSGSSFGRVAYCGETVFCVIEPYSVSLFSYVQCGFTVFTVVTPFSLGLRQAHSI
jgi:hypothetical protein